MTHHPFLDSYVLHRMSRYLFPLPIADCKRCLPRQLGNSYKSSSASPSTFATYLMYIVHLISIDLQSSRSFNTHTATVTVMSPDRTTCWPIIWIALPTAPFVNQSTTFASVSSFFRVLLLYSWLPSKRTIKHWSHRTSIISNIGRIEHRLYRTSVASNIDHIEHRSYRTLIVPNPVDSHYAADDLYQISSRTKRTIDLDRRPYPTDGRTDESNQKFGTSK
jgi:hypothetical protein